MNGYDKKGDDNIMFGKETDTFVQSLLLVQFYDFDFCRDIDLVTTFNNTLIHYFILSCLT